jgi:hypothetical protein
MRADMNSITRGIFGATLLAALAGCGSGLGTTSSTTGSGGTGSATSGTAQVELGSGSGTSFQNGVLKIQVSKLAAGGTTGVTANIVDANNGNALYTAQSVVVSFTSICASAGTATIDASVTTLTGTASASYSAAGCNGSDTITATATIGTTTLTATGKLTIQPASLGSLVFQGPAVPSEIGLAGMGGVTSSKVTFKLLDSNGNAASGVTMNFSLDTTTGGVAIKPLTAVTGSDGTASTFIQAGTEHTVVHVTASATSNGVTVTGGSTGVVISTGIATERNFTLVFNRHSVEGSGFFGAGATAVATVFLSDRFQNPVPSTVVSFTTNGGGITSSCTTAADGTCPATWTAQGGLPQDDSNVFVTDHAHVLAYTTGEEHFTDTDGNGVFNNGDTYLSFAHTAVPIDGFLGTSQPAQDDMGDPYMDQNENGQFDPQEFYASPNSGARRAPDGKWYGIACGGLNSTATSVSAKDQAGITRTVQCGGTSLIIGKEDCIVMSTTALFVLDLSGTNTGPTTGGAASTVTASTSGTQAIYYIVDANGDVPPQGTLVHIDVTNLVGASISVNGTTSDVTVPDLPDACSTGTNGTLPTNGATGPFKGYPLIVTVTKSPTGTTAPGGSFSINLTTVNTKLTSTGIVVPVQ